MISIRDKKDCCGCTACASICPKGAIFMEPDALGFIYPEVDVSLCIECGLCDKVCAFNESYEKFTDFEAPIHYGIRHRDMKTLMDSQSGGAFTALSDVVLDRGGVVYGAGWSDDFVVVHKRAETKEQRNALRGSKYVQSDLRGVFAQVKQDLKEGREVLFSGTPCQVAGLKSFIGKNKSENLITVDIICHGVPSPSIFEDNKQRLEHQYKGKIQHINMRNKVRFGHPSHIESYLINDKYYHDYRFTYLFYKHIMLRPSCGECHYCSLQRSGDITIADFWGWQKVNKSFAKDERGCSLILINSHKGNILFEQSKSFLTIILPSLKECLQDHLRKPTRLSSLSSDFIDLYLSHGYEAVLQKYGTPTMKEKIKRYIRSNLIKVKFLLYR